MHRTQSFFPDENNNRKMVMVYNNGDFEKGKGNID